MPTKKVSDKKPDKLQLFKSTDNGQYYVRRVASNGQIRQSSEGYMRRASAMKALVSLQAAAVADPDFLTPAEIKKLGL